MIEPVKLGNFFIVFFSAAMVIMLGALYALLFALARIKKHAYMMSWAYFSYAGLFIATLLLAYAANLLQQPLWIAIVILMLVGYLLAPHAIWHLCVSTHADDSKAVPPNKIFDTQRLRER